MVNIFVGAIKRLKAGNETAAGLRQTFREGAARFPLRQPAAGLPLGAAPPLEPCLLFCAGPRLPPFARRCFCQSPRPLLGLPGLAVLAFPAPAHVRAPALA